MYYCMCSLFFFKASATTEIYTYLHTLSLHDSRPIAGTSRDGSRPSMHTLETGMSDPLDKKLPLDSWHRAKGARMVSFADYAMPIQYRSEEHTSELQSLMRNSYAVFCLKKKK